MRILNSVLIALALSLGSLHASARSAAVFINFGDSGHLDSEMAKSAERARAVFTKLGYDFTLLSPAPDIVQKAEAALSRLADTNPEELVLITHGHGEIMDPLPDNGRFPTMRTRPGPYTAEPITFVFVNGRVGTVADEDYWSRGHAGIGDFRRWLTDFRNRSPETKIDVVLAECYSGAAARLLNELPGVRVFSGASDHEKASLRKDARGAKFAYVDFYLDELGRGEHRDSFEIFETSRSRWMSFSASEKDKLAEVPWSPVDARINSWCAANPIPGRKTDLRLTPEVEKLKALSFATLKYEDGAGAVWRSLNKCDSGKKLRQHQDGLRLATEQWARIANVFKARLGQLTLEDIARAKENLDSSGSHEPELREIVTKVRTPETLAAFQRETATLFERSVKCYRETRSVACGRGLNPYPFASLLKDASWDETRIKKACAFETDATITPCLKAIAAIVDAQPGLAAERVRRILSRTIEYAVEACSSQRADYYRSCYDRFWSEADERTLDLLSR